MKVAIQIESAPHGMIRAFQYLILGLALVAIFYSPVGHTNNTAACDDCGIYESLCKGKPVHWYILDENGSVVRGDPKQLLRSSQALEFFNSVKRKHPGKFHSREVCADNPLA